ncbi:MAG: TolC family protein [Acidobacteria bacterium]|nr:TolC family protein [Acidobacteriota bacterium]
MQNLIRFLASVLAIAGTVIVLTPAVVRAQAPLTLNEAITRAIRQHPSMREAAADVTEAEARADQARAAWLPRVDFVEAWQRGDQPVFVFGSLLSQRRFGPENFAIDALNHPDPISNYHTAITAEELVFDGGRRESGIRQARLGAQIASVAGQDAVRALRTAVTQSYGQVLMAVAQRRAADAALQSADEDLLRAEHRRDAGMGTDADVLAVRVHRSQVRERQISAASQETIARAQLNDAMGEPLDGVYALQLPQTVDTALPTAAAIERDELAGRADVSQAVLQEQLAREARKSSRGAFLPQVGVQGGLEFNGASFAEQARSWGVGAFVRWNLFSGLADAARLRETAAAQIRAEAGRQRVESAARVEVRSAIARVESARAREEVGRTARLQAKESQRIIRDRYEAGLASVNDVLRAADAVLETELQHTMALVDVLVSGAMLDRARGK